MDSDDYSVTSREYKLMLDIRRFQSGEEGVEELAKLVKSLAGTVGGADKVEFQFDDDPGTKRDTCYFNSDSHGLRREGYIVRLRETINGGDEEHFRLTLKYRGENRYDVAEVKIGFEGQDLPEGVKAKFEQDILPPFRSKYSKSLSCNGDDEPDITTIESAEQLLPGLTALGLPSDRPLTRINDFTAYELTRKLCKLKYDGIKIKASLRFWFPTEAREGIPLVAEFSYGYKGKKKLELHERFPRKAVDGANRLFYALQREREWFDFNATTKTAHAHEGI